MAGDEYESLRALVQSCTRTQQEAAAFRAQRDEARREVCELLCNPPKSEERIIALPHELAKIRGWDCYKENT